MLSATKSDRIENTSWLLRTRLMTFSVSVSPFLLFYLPLVANEVPFLVLQTVTSWCSIFVATKTRRSIGQRLIFSLKLAALRTMGRSLQISCLRSQPILTTGSNFSWSLGSSTPRSRTPVVPSTRALVRALVTFQLSWQYSTRQSHKILACVRHLQRVHSAALLDKHHARHWGLQVLDCAPLRISQPCHGRLIL